MPSNSTMTKFEQSVEAPSKKSKQIRNNPIKDMFETPILQSFMIKSNLTINLLNLVNTLPIPLVNSELSCRSGTIIAIKYKNIIKGKENLFKTKRGFKNTCHLIMCHTLEKRQKKLIHIRITAIGTFQVVGIPSIDVEKIVYKVFLILEKLNKNNNIFTSVSTIHNDISCDENKTENNRGIADYAPVVNRLEIVIVPIFNNYALPLSSLVTKKIFENSKIQIVQKFIDNNFLSFTVPRDSAVTIKKSFAYEDFRHHPLRYITWNKKYGKIIRYIDYDSYTTLLKDIQKDNAQCKKYLTLRLFSTGKVLISGFDDILIKEGVEKFLDVCDKF
jgi:hypothetical protein